MSLPEKIDSLPVKRAVKVFVFGTNREYEHYCRKQKVRPSGEPEWRRTFLQAFATVLERSQNGEKEG
nr:MAG TPA: hypothetical protein [Caudoviricetes sp.]